MKVFPMGGDLWMVVRSAMSEKLYLTTQRYPTITYPETVKISLTVHPTKEIPIAQKKSQQRRPAHRPKEIVCNQGRVIRLVVRRSFGRVSLVSRGYE